MEWRGRRGEGVPGGMVVARRRRAAAAVVAPPGKKGERERKREGSEWAVGEASYGPLEAQMEDNWAE